MKRDIHQKAKNIDLKIGYLLKVRRKFLEDRPTEIKFYWGNNRSIYLPTSHLIIPLEDDEKGVEDICDKLVEDFLEHIENSIASLRIEFENL